MLLLRFVPFPGIAFWFVGRQLPDRPNEAINADSFFHDYVPDVAQVPQSNYLLTYLGLPGSSRDSLQDPVSLSCIALAAPIVDFRVLVPPVTSTGTYITDCATLARFLQPIATRQHKIQV
jgi:hypothetical protein